MSLHFGNWCNTASRINVTDESWGHAQMQRIPYFASFFSLGVNLTRHLLKSYIIPFKNFLLLHTSVVYLKYFGKRLSKNPKWQLLSERDGWPARNWMQYPNFLFSWDPWQPSTFTNFELKNVRHYIRQCFGKCILKAPKTLPARGAEFEVPALCWFVTKTLFSIPILI